MGKGSKQRPRQVDKKKFEDNWEAIFGEKKENPDLDMDGHVRYKPHPETGEMIPDYMWHQFGMWKPKPKSHFVVRDYPDYRSPITGKLISGRRQHQYDLHSNGCRVYEGRESEERAAQSHRDQSEAQFHRKLDKSMAETLNDIKYQNNPPPERDKNGKPKVSFTW